MIRAAARGAMIRAHGKRISFSVEYTKQRRLPVEAKEVGPGACTALPLCSNPRSCAYSRDLPQLLQQSTEHPNDCARPGPKVVAWEFKEAEGHSIDFRIEFVEPEMLAGNNSPTAPQTSCVSIRPHRLHSGSEAKSEDTE